jgi:hypothetical protein
MMAEVAPVLKAMRSAAGSGGLVGSGVAEGAGAVVAVGGGVSVALGSGASVALGLGLAAAEVSVGVSVAIASTVGAEVGAGVLPQAESRRLATNSALTIIG